MILFNKTKEETLCEVELPVIRDTVKCLANTSDIVDETIRRKNEVHPDDELEYRVSDEEMAELHWRSAMRDNLDLCMNEKLELVLFFCGIPFIRAGAA